MVWVRAASFSRFSKLWGRIDKPLLKGDYLIEIENNFDATAFTGKKSLVLTTRSLLGGESATTSLSFFLIGGLLLLLALALLCGNRLTRGRLSAPLVLVD